MFPKIAIERVINSKIKKGPCSGALRTELERDRYPFIYPRDTTRIAMALNKLGKQKMVEKHYLVIKNLQFHDGRWVQRYNYEGKASISRPKETDSTAMVVAGICHHFLMTKNYNFIKKIWDSVLLGLKYLSSMKKDDLIFSEHAIHESKEIEEGFEIWTNCWTSKAFLLASMVAKELNKNSLARKFNEFGENLFEKIMDNFWNGRHFVKCIKPNGEVVEGKIISIIAPAWTELIPDNSKEIKKTVRYLRSLFDYKIGGYQRFKKFEFVKDWHWYDGGSGSWLTHTIIMARLHMKLKQYEKAKECLRFVKKIIKTFNSLPEHISRLKEFLEWKKNEYELGVHVTPWLIKATKNAEKNIKYWNWNKKRNKVVPWVKSIVWPSAELILNFETFKNLWEKC